jgi:serine/threonine protein kinase
MSPEACLSEDVALELATGHLSAPEAASARTHLDGCERCRKWVAQLARVETDQGPERPTPHDMLGPYEVLRHVGSGAMSFVYAAYDRALGRTVALKVLRPELSDGPRRARLLREAQAMARLSHPNVVHVYETKEWQGRLYIAMELIEGQTLRQWLAASTRHWSEVVSIFADAARGLAAAHAAGIIHRDFKPDNVLLGTDGRAHVTDFGLARWMDDANDLSLTQSGTFVGTPVYMSPEHLPGGQVDALSDQFSFCVALYEGLFGRRPFSGSTVAELGEAMGRGAIEAPFKGRSVPRWLRNIVLQGLKAERGQRHASMSALADALCAGNVSGLRRTILPVAAAVIFSAALWLGWQQWGRPAPVEQVSPSPMIREPQPVEVLAAPAPQPPVVSPSVQPTVAPMRPRVLAVDPKSPYAR